jgi:hypothetical protein
MQRGSLLGRPGLPTATSPDDAFAYCGDPGPARGAIRVALCVLCVLRG